ncbi:DNA protecting protein DprA [Vibrio navarrensis]|uniref:DNA-protecting protein DprA n=1 Tax=Vibrio navarrensis TaxID=29495 RepID=A0AAJ4LU83_9VIBR|nr:MULTISPECIES: DNA-processing protein DprA [Vibrio]KJR39474.1 DNA processing protein DprA [Vibrio sp. S234-5]MBE3653913.1 DNA protecting protein DprA [Vibrio navarrensis]MBE3657660.1 DNA protecting protein DprA [Vibrio navarrensis]MBE3662071.1 DNA protecting protein DprA [Vibrio navarrensis]MBE4605521.1 DNA protecting protein DprA [Vibrio navarrensis]
MSEQELIAWLSLSFTPQIGVKRLAKLLSIDSPLNILAYSDNALLNLGFSAVQLAYLRQEARRDVEASLTWQLQQGHHILTLVDDDYPPLLKEAGAAPPYLFVKGEVGALSKPQLAMVGSRNASLEGLQHARQFAEFLVQQGLAVTSGLALGIDGHAHDGALNAGGDTIAVLGSGLEHIYPARHRKLAQRIAEQGALVSEFRPDAKPRAENFPRRNRIISGLALGVLVVEAAEKSGSLITARYAAEQGREVFALPCSISSVNGRGGNQLIKNGACLVSEPNDILREIQSLLDWSYQQQTGDLFSPLNTEEQLPFSELLANVGSEATPVDILANRTNIPVQEVMMQLLELELSGHVVAINGGYIRRGRG